MLRSCGFPKSPPVPLSSWLTFGLNQRFPNCIVTPWGDMTSSQRHPAWQGDCKVTDYGAEALSAGCAPFCRFWGTLLSNWTCFTLRLQNQEVSANDITTLHIIGLSALTFEFPLVKGGIVMLMCLETPGLNDTFLAYSQFSFATTLANMGIFTFLVFAFISTYETSSKPWKCYRGGPRYPFQEPPWILKSVGVRTCRFGPPGPSKPKLELGSGWVQKVT